MSAVVNVCPQVTLHIGLGVVAAGVILSLFSILRFATWISRTYYVLPSLSVPPRLLADHACMHARCALLSFTCLSVPPPSP